MKVAVDLEGVIVDTNSLFIEELNSFLASNFPESSVRLERDQIRGWRMAGIRQPLADLMGWEEEVAEKFMFGDGSWKGYIPITERIWKEETSRFPLVDERVGRALGDLRSHVKECGGEVHLVTARKRVDKAIEKKLENEGLSSFFDSIIIESDKHRLDYRYYIDDNPRLFPRLENGKIQLVRKQPWNRDTEPEKPHCRVAGIRESVEVIDDLD